ncbi:MAG: DMT family transporter [Pseudomonadota bacterium]
MLLLVLLAAIWGSSFLFIRLSVAYFGPVPLTASRSLIAACTLVPIMLLHGSWPVFRQYWKHLLIVGLISTALPFTFLSISTQYTSAGFASILNAFTPIFSAIIAWLWLQEKLTVPAMVGIGLSFVGLLVMVLDRETIIASFPLLPVLAGMAATFLYGLTGNYSRKFLVGVPPLVVSAGCQVFSTLCLMPVALLQWPAEPVPMVGWLCAAVLGILCTGLAFIIYFHLLATVGVARTVIVTYLAPVFAMLWGFLFLAENVTLKMLIGAGLIMLGIGLTTWRAAGVAKPMASVGTPR